VGSAEIVVTAAGGSESAAEEFTYMQQVISSISPWWGTYLGGTSITITGDYLGGTTSVTVGGVPATNLQVINEHNIIVTTPPGSVGSVDVVLIGSKGTVTARSAFTFVTVMVPDWATLVEAHPDPDVVFDATLRTSIITTGYAWRVRDTATQIEMVLIPPGTFQMGCSPPSNWPCRPQEIPVHEVTLTNAFYIGRHEVTQAEWTAVMGSNPSYFQGASFPDHLSMPVESTSVSKIDLFLESSGMRLPTEAEWEYSCRAGTTTALHGCALFPAGSNDESDLVQIAWCQGNSPSGSGDDRPRSVGLRLGNGFGLHDMLGNVQELVSDRFAYYPSEPQVNPVGPPVGNSRIWRGGLWGSGTYYCRSSSRYDRNVSYYDDDEWTGGGFASYGFRVARNP
jgi:formylglycine-generating enzyme required for sulfatase activity